jgi:hypothetical protein
MAKTFWISQMRKTNLVLARFSAIVGNVTSFVGSRWQIWRELEILECEKSPTTTRRLNAHPLTPPPFSHYGGTLRTISDQIKLEGIILNLWTKKIFIDTKSR